MSASDPDPARAPRAPHHSDSGLPPTRRFARSAVPPIDGYDTTSPVAAANAPAHPEDDLWSHEQSTRRFEPRGGGAYPMDGGVVKVAKSKAPITGPSIATEAFELSVPPPSVLGSSATPSAFVIDALADLAADDAERPAPPPRRVPGTRSVPPPGFGSK